MFHDGACQYQIELSRAELGEGTGVADDDAGGGAGVRLVIVHHDDVDGSRACPKEELRGRGRERSAAAAEIEDPQLFPGKPGNDAKNVSREPKGLIEGNCFRVRRVIGSVVGRQGFRFRHARGGGRPAGRAKQQLHVGCFLQLQARLPFRRELTERTGGGGRKKLRLLTTMSGVECRCLDRRHLRTSSEMHMAGEAQAARTTEEGAHHSQTPIGSLNRAPSAE